jgi:hypothetical protein
VERLDPVFNRLRVVEALLAQGWAQSQAIGHPRLWECFRADARRRMRDLLRRDAVDLGAEGYAPEAFEVRFGGGGGGGDSGAGDSWPPLVVPASDGGEIRLRGRIDRIDRRAATGSAQGERWLVIDYKSSKAGTHNAKLNAKHLLYPSLQLPAYAAVVAAHTGAGASVDATYRSFAGGMDRALSAALEKQERQLEEVIVTQPEPGEVCFAGPPRRPPENLGQALRAVAGGIREGLFPVQSLSCAFCPFTALCRVQSLSLEGEQ